MQVPVALTVTEPAPAIALTKTVGTTPGVCATTDEISVPSGTTVYYCYRVANTGDVTLNLHDLADSELGTIFTGLSYVLTPGSSVNTVQAGLSIPAVINATTVNTGTWTAYNAGPSNQITASDTATVTVALPAPAITLTKTVGTVPGVCAATDSITVAPGTTVYYCYDVANTGNLTLNLHNLADSELGTIFTGLSYALYTRQQCQHGPGRPEHPRGDQRHHGQHRHLDRVQCRSEQPDHGQRHGDGDGTLRR